MIFNELKTAFRWYSALNKQNRFKGYCQQLCNFGLVTTCNDLLPFQINTPAFGTPTTWKLIYLDGTITIPAIGSTATYDASGWSAGGASFNMTIFYNFLIAGSNSKTVTGQTSTDGAFNSLVSYYNALGYGLIATYDSSTNIFTLQNPTDVGTAGNGKQITGFTVIGAGAPTGVSGGATFSGGVDATTGTELDISSCAVYVNKYTGADSSIYLTYNGGSLSGCIPTQLECGKWYSTLEDENDITLYSEVFEVTLVEGDETTYPTLDPYLFTPLRFYDALDKQTRYRSNCESACNFYQLSDNTRLPTFMFRASSIGTIQEFKVIGVDDECELDIEITNINIVSYLGYEYAYYSGDSIDNLPCGKFYIRISDETQTWYSELFELVDMSAVDVTSDYLTDDDGVTLTTDGGDILTID